MTLKKAAGVFKSQKGMTLIEVLASFAILTVVLLFFTSFFIQSAKTNEQVEATIDATYVAQVCIEEATKVRRTIGRWQIGTKQIKDNLTFADDPSSEAGIAVLSGQHASYYVQMKIYDKARNGKTVVQVYRDSTKAKLMAQMETRLVWEE